MGQINARDWTFEIKVEDEAMPGTFIDVEIGGLTAFTLNPAESEETADTTVFESNGVHESQAMQRGATLALTGMWARDAAGARDAGQEACNALAALVGEASLGTVRFKHDSQTDWTVWSAWASAGEVGGETNAKTSWSVTFTKSGPATTEVAA